MSIGPGGSGGYINWTEKSGTKMMLAFDVVTNEVHHWQTDITEHPVESGANIADHVRRMLDEVNVEVLISNTPLESRYANVGPYSEAVPLVGTGGYNAFLAPFIPQIRRSGLLVNTPLNVKKPGLMLPLNPAGAAVGLALAGINALTNTPAVATVYDEADQPNLAYPQNSVTTYTFPNIDVVAQVAAKLRDLQASATLVNLVTTRVAYTSFAIKDVQMKRDGKTGESAWFQISFREVRLVQTISGSVTAPKTPKQALPVTNGDTPPTPAPGANTTTGYQLPGIITSGLKNFFGLT